MVFFDGILFGKASSSGTEQRHLQPFAGVAAGGVPVYPRGKQNKGTRSSD